MGGFRRKRFWGFLARKLIAVLALFSYLVTIIGLPVPHFSEKDRTRPFACQDRECGCRNSDDCWHHCCCFSIQERIAWAKNHDVSPPPDIPSETAQGWHVPRLRDRDNGPSQSQQVCEKCRQPHAEDGCIASERNRASAEPSKSKTCCSEKPAKDSGIRVVGFQTLRCKGFSTQWVVVGTVAPPLTNALWETALVPGDWLTSSSFELLSFDPIPPVPPPRHFCV
jgi:hypothetical protein